VQQSSDNKGTPITRYNIFINEGVDGSIFHNITSYDGHSATFSINAGDTYGNFTVFVGGIYRIKTTAVN
jgi:hypothetical protein